MYCKQLYHVALTLARECATIAGDEGAEGVGHACQDILDSLECSKLRVPSHARLMACAESLSNGDYIFRLANRLPMNAALPQAFQEVVQLALLEDYKPQVLPGRLLVVMMYTSHMMLECLRNKHAEYVIPIARSLADVLSDSSIREHVLLTFNSGFCGLTADDDDDDDDDDTRPEEADDKTNPNVSGSGLARLLNLSVNLLSWYYTQ